MADTLAWHRTDWVEVNSQDGLHRSRTQLLVGIHRADWGRVSITVKLYRRTYTRADGVWREKTPGISHGHAGGRTEDVEIVRDTGELYQRPGFQSPVRVARSEGIAFIRALEIDDGQYVVRIPEGTETSWVVQGEQDVRVTVPLPPHRIAITIEDSAPASAAPPLPEWPDDPYPSLW